MAGWNSQVGALSTGHWISRGTLKQDVSDDPPRPSPLVPRPWPLAPRPSMTLLDESFLRKLDVLSVVTRRPVHGQLRGAHRSRRTGAGMVFTDFRPYSVGDDIRNIDWGIYLRMDRLILKLFEEEADLPRLHPQLPRRPCADVGAVDVKVVEQAVHRRLRRVVKRAQEEAGAVVDLRAVDLLVARDVDPPIAELQIEGDGLRGEPVRSRYRHGGRKSQGQVPATESHSVPYFSNCGDRFDPWTATWHVVQLR